MDCENKAIALWFSQQARHLADGAKWSRRRLASGPLWLPSARDLHERELMAQMPPRRHRPAPREISEILLRTAVDAGVSASNAAFAIAQRTPQEMGVPEAQMQRRD
jgi:hypothetical protein